MPPCRASVKIFNYYYKKWRLSHDLNKSIDRRNEKKRGKKRLKKERG
jgi:hypothetical protein